MELFVLKFFVWLFFFGSLFFLSILILISYNFGAMEVIDNISKMVDPRWRLYAQMASYDAIIDK